MSSDSIVKVLALLNLQLLLDDCLLLIELSQLHGKFATEPIVKTYY